MLKFSRPTVPIAAATFALLATTSTAGAAVLITEVIPNVTTTATRGDVVEVFNTGPNPVDLTGWVLSDRDNDPVAGVPEEPTFAPMSLGVADEMSSECWQTTFTSEPTSATTTKFRARQ